MYATSRRTSVVAVVIAALATCACSGSATTGPNSGRRPRKPPP